MPRIEVRDLSRETPLRFEGGRKEYDYKWGAKNLMASNMMQGWEVANIKEDKIKPSILLQNAGLPPDGTLQTEHSILLRRKKEIGEEMRERKRQLHAQRLRKERELWRDLGEAVRSENVKKLNDVVHEIIERTVEKIGE